VLAGVVALRDRAPDPDPLPTWKTAHVFLSKHHGLGNDFLVVLDERHDQPVVVDAALAQRVCDRRRGVGADGLIHGAAPREDERAAGIDVVMHLFNSDGSRAEMSGNGIRCLGQAVARAKGWSSGAVVAQTDAGRRPLHIAPGTDAVSVEVSVDMGIAGPGPHVPEPVAEYLPEHFATVDMGNPHLVVLVDDPASVDLTTEGAWLEQQFPAGVNVKYVNVTPDRSSMTLRVWERGAGVTEACGTGACAAALTASRWGLIDDRVTVRMPGGDAEVVLGADDAVTLIGPAVFIADVVIDAEVP
jgi:diaminopimelate epimerase